MLQQPHVGGDGEDVHEVEEDVHDNDDSQVNQALHTDIPHLPLFPGQVWLVGLQGAADTRHKARDLHIATLQLIENTLILLLMQK